MKMGTIKYMLITFLCLTIMACGGEKEKKYASKAPQKTEKVKKAPDKKPTPEKKEAGSEEAATVSPEQLKKANEIIANVSNDDIAKVDSPLKYKMLCASCHGFKGNMKVNGAKDLTLSKLPLEESVAQLHFGKGLMTPFKGVMTEAEIVAVAKYIETEFRK